LMLPYYVGLRSATKSYDASPYTVTVTKMMVEKSRHPISVGRHKVVFQTSTRIETMPF
jgi:hypothetical protein